MIYFDNNATTEVTAPVFEAMKLFYQAEFGNPSSPHQAGNLPRVAVETARNQFAKAMGVSATEITFVGTGSEANTHTIIGGMLSPLEKGKNLVISAIEHPSVREAARFAAKKFDFELRIAPFEIRNGRVAAEPFFERIDQNTKVVSIMLANNETGVLMPVGEIFEKAATFGCIRHCDAAQGMGKIPIIPRDLHCDALTLAPHKFHGPKGIGVYYQKRGVKIDPWILGGSQEYGRRAGTENVAGIVGAGEAVAQITPEVHQKLGVIRDYFEAQLASQLHDKVVINFQNLPRIPNSSSVQFLGKDANLLLIKLDQRGICVSAGSACSSGSLSVSKILLASGLTEKQAASTLRITFSRNNTLEEVDTCIQVLKDLL